jgi:hypothetical protein
LRDKLEETVNECLLKGKCVQELHELSPRQEFNYIVINHEEQAPLDVPIFNRQIYVMAEQIGRLETRLKGRKNEQHTS